MKTKHWIALIATAVAIALAPSAIAQPASDPAPDDVKTTVQLLVVKIQQKLQKTTERPTEAGFAAELAEFDKIIAGNPKASPEDLAQVLVMQSGFYAEVLGDYDKAAALVRRIKTDYPKTQAAEHAGDMLKQLDQIRAMETVRAALQPGMEFPDFSVTDTAGKPLSLSQYKGKVVLIDFWATWCPPCVEEIPHVVAAYGKYHDKGFEVIGISLDREKDALLKYTEKNKMPWPQYYDAANPDASLADKYGIEAIPSTFLIGKDGKIVATDLRGDDLEKQLAKLLAK
ncbi:MAG: TlpA family protein disulfide reductase [Opitutaceae bacterium]|jgi:peroxiredoxin|nr:TlpA family protein disulfide reductase [Opitutaceae bacterium]